jgi:hypothetical protein
MKYVNANFTGTAPGCGGGGGSATPRRDILGFYPGAFSWLAAVLADSSYRTKGDAIMASIRSTPNNGTSGPALNGANPTNFSGHALKVRNESTFGWSRTMQFRG